ncbi:hypothetical protein COCMIDRAFT_82586 [Bipolaris oryzae ATCC 44560]|uniref:Box C/D snoRNA protein 1 n=1 Tax=Bipolaris oryzae ATCC 44560 TaxID=930090 RepID=W7A290_COCMI|nr:uncharacterized protein COCMIDRAFT_82586 [Bipolaris oryzae ATCC 44560]EUC50141.1 hypothetical protein COCMIDRAFT_82586 [Bipolaris oryzae ATCC 44560]
MDNTSSAPLLNELCSVCNTTQFKYRCPGCSARTCSLPCYKKHQQWAQCSGKRDPTKFVKKSELLTPTGIDHDFNFLSRIERNLDKADKVAAHASAAAPSEALSNRQRAGVPYAKLEAAAAVNIIRAPQGLSRQRENKSHMSATKKASRNIVWTVEWIDGASKTRVLTQTSSVQQIKDAQPFAHYDINSKSKKRKLNTEIPATTNLESIHSQQHVAPVAEDQEQSLQQIHVDVPISDAQSEPVSPARGGGGGATPPRSEKKQTSKREADMADRHPSDNGHDEPSAHTMGPGGQPRFFLLKPRTSTSRHVLIPLDYTCTLAESLHGRTILEFPTIHVFPPDMDELPKEEFMLEEEYAELEGEQQKEFDELMGELDPEILKRLKEGEDGMAKNGIGNAEEEVDSKKILDVLKQDLGGRL